MSVLDRLDFTTRVAKRAQYEAFEFSVGDDGVVVRNCSHEDPSEHEYLVTVDDGVPTRCACPADEQYDGACKHRVAVAIREPVLDAAVAADVAADGGTAVERQNQCDEDSDPPEECTCAELGGDFPCWECVRTGRTDVPE